MSTGERQKNGVSFRRQNLESLAAGDTYRSAFTDAPQSHRWRYLPAIQRFYYCFGKLRQNS